MKEIHVVAAVICNDLKHKKEILATARGYGEFKGQWEFPGGKVEMGEDLSSALKREIREELTVEIILGEQIKTIEYTYPNFHLKMDCFWAEISSGELKLVEAQASKWLKKKDLYSVNWLPADIELIDILAKEMEED